MRSWSSTTPLCRRRGTARLGGTAIRHDVGKTANCQTLVSLTLARGEVPVAVGLALFLPETWTSDPDRMVSAGVPEGLRAARTKLEIAVAEIDRAREGGVRFGCVLADAGYGSASFRLALSERWPELGRRDSGRSKVYPADVMMIFPVAGRGRPRKRHVPDQVSVAAETILADMSGRAVTWRRAPKASCGLASGPARSDGRWSDPEDRRNGQPAPAR